MSRLVDAQNKRFMVWLLIAVPCIVLLLLIWLLGNRYLTMQQYQTKNEVLQQSYTWLHTQTQSLLERRTALGKPTLRYIGEAKELGVALQEGLGKFGLQGKLTTDKGGWKIVLNRGQGDRVLAFMEAAVIAGAQIVQVQLSRQDKRGYVKGSLQFVPLWDQAP